MRGMSLDRWIGLESISGTVSDSNIPELVSGQNFLIYNMEQRHLLTPQAVLEVILNVTRCNYALAPSSNIRHRQNT